MDSYLASIFDTIQRSEYDSGLRPGPQKSGVVLVKLQILYGRFKINTGTIIISEYYYNVII